MNPKEDDLRNRLERLKEPTERVPTDEELHERLRNLKGTPAAGPVLKSKYVHFPTVKTDSEQVEHLMKQCTEEAEIENSHSAPSTSVDELEKRLQMLKSEIEKVPNTLRPQEHSHKSDTKRLLEKILAEAAIEKSMEQEYPHIASMTARSLSKFEDMDISDPEEEFCTICVRRPQWICMSCDRKAFCSRCFTEFHDEMEDHRKKPVSGQKKQVFDSDEYSDSD